MLSRDLGVPDRRLAVRPLQACSRHRVQAESAFDAFQHRRLQVLTGTAGACTRSRSRDATPLTGTGATRMEGMLQAVGCAAMEQLSLGEAPV
jgi:hypothetical protein